MKMLIAMVFVLMGNVAEARSGLKPIVTCSKGITRVLVGSQPAKGSSLWIGIYQKESMGIYQLKSMEPVLKHDAAIFREFFVSANNRLTITEEGDDMAGEVPELVGELIVGKEKKKVLKPMSCVYADKN